MVENLRRVVVTGMGMVSPLGLNLQTSWEAILAGKTGVDRIRSFDPSNLPCQIAAEVKNFDPKNFIDAKEANRSSRFIQFALVAAMEAMKDSGLDIKGANTDLWGCSIGVGIGDIAEIVNTAYVLKEKGARRVSPFFIPYVIVNMAAGIVANEFHLRGPNLCTATACTSSAHAVGESWLYIRNGYADVMVAGGTEAAICEVSIAGFANMKALSRNNENPGLASRPFDLNRDGFVMGEGSAILVLEELEHARKRGATIYAEIAGYGMSADAHHITQPSPEGEGAQRSMKSALKAGGVEASMVDYINAHGTSTKFNDLCETQAITAVFPHARNGLLVSSTKGATGHCLGAAGAIESLLTVKAIKEGILPPTANLLTPDPECSLNYLPQKALEKQTTYALSNSFGFGGTNASLLFKRFV